MLLHVLLLASEIYLSVFFENSIDRGEVPWSSAFLKKGGPELGPAWRSVAGLIDRLEKNFGVARQMVLRKEGSKMTTMTSLNFFAGFYLHFG